MAAKPPPGYGSNRRRMLAVKLWMGVVVANLLGLLAAYFVASGIRAGTGDADLLLPLYYVTMVLAGVADALWVDEVMFKGAFRRSIQGYTGRLSSSRGADNNEDVEDAAAAMQRPTIGFPLVVVVCTLLTYGAFNLVNRGFDGWWREVGRSIDTLRNDTDTSARIQAIRELSVHKEPEILGILEMHLADEDPTVGAWAAWAIGRQRDNVAMNMNRVPPLVERVRKGPPEVRHEALLTLARLQHQAIAKQVADELAADLDSGEPVDIRLLWALGYVQHPDTIGVLDQALYHGDETVQRLAAWALAQQRDSGKGRESADLLEQRLPSAPFLTKCAIVHSLGVVTDERSNLALIHAYDGLTPEERLKTCELLSIGVAPDGKADYQDLLLPQASLGMKIFQAMGQMRATTPQIRSEVEPWLEGVIASEQTDTLVREAARDLLAGIRQQRNDRP